MSGKDAEQQLHELFRDAFRQRRGVGGPGDDCAVLRPPKASVLHQTVDQVVEGVHVEWGTPPAVFARKLLGRTLSDLAAAGARPWALSWTICAPAKTAGHAWLKRLANAFLAEAESYSVSVVGGDVSSAPDGAPVVLSCTALGQGPKIAPGRGGALPGDQILVTGKLGGAVSSGRHLRPQPRLDQGARLLRDCRPHAMMDLSDGLAVDLQRILSASQVGAQIDLARIPWANQGQQTRAQRAIELGEGEDYELLAVLSPRATQSLLKTRVGKRDWTCIGEIVAGRRLSWLDAGAKLPRFKPQPWQHKLTRP